MVKTKIVATLGPASSTESVLRKMFIRGLDTVRLNFSHGTHREHMSRINMVRVLNRKMRRAIKIMQDLEGYRIRIGRLSKPIDLKRGAVLYLTQKETGGSKDEVPFDYTGPLKVISRKSKVFIDDGRIVLEVESCDKSRLKTRVVAAGVLKQDKGINIPGVKLEFDALTDKDRKDVEIAITEKLDFVAQSFVRSAKDIRLLRKIIHHRHPGCGIFAKIESRQALANLDSIIEETEGIIVARGDLGICVPIYKVPVIQKEVVKRCRLKGKPVIVATQMLDSMTEDVMPTRAEVSDVANAILDGATHLLLSGETAVGKHPDMVVDMMNKIIKETETYRETLDSLLTA